MKTDSLFCGLYKHSNICFTDDYTCLDGRPLTDYAGYISITDGGRTCQRWDRQTPHAHQYDNSIYFSKDGSLENAANYCRSMLGVIPYCYTTDPHVRFQYCGARICGGATCGGKRTEPQGELSFVFDTVIDCLWTLVAPEDQRIVFEIINMDIEDDFACAIAFLEIYEMTPSFLSHGRYCGFSTCYVTSRSHILFIRLFSARQTDGAFVANFSHADVKETVTETTSSQYPIGHVWCPGYVDLAMYRGKVNVTNGGRVCQDWTTSSRYSLPLTDNTFKVDGSRKKAHNYCRNFGNDHLPWCLTTDPYKPYQLCHETICAGSPCGGTVTTLAGWLSAVHRKHADDFNDVDCLWTLLAPKDYVVDILVLYVFPRLKRDPDCIHVYLSFYEVQLNRKTVCGHDTFPVSFTSDLNQLFVRFYSSVNGPGPGFNLTYICRHKNDLGWQTTTEMSTNRLTANTTGIQNDLGRQTTYGKIIYTGMGNTTTIKDKVKLRNKTGTHVYLTTETETEMSTDTVETTGTAKTTGSEATTNYPGMITVAATTVVYLLKPSWPYSCGTGICRTYMNCIENWNIIN